jgi:large subunit ribosomal protein L10
LNREQKAAVIDEIAAEIQEADTIYAVDYRGISVPAAAELRTKLRDADATFRIVKNTPRSPSSRSCWTARPR